ncbi:MAG: HU family DNA-binding protein [Hyphomicrobiales bacterium]|nr:HU family DNA-binding protein [Hyphomicrobiales bacterium]
MADKVYWTTPGLTREQARKLVDEVLQEIVDALIQDGKVMLTGFGNFAVSSKGARVGRNPKTGEEYPIAARKSVSFKAAGGVRRAVAAKTPKPVRAKRLRHDEDKRQDRAP